MTQKTNPTEYFIEQMGLVAQADGLPRIAGRLLGLMILEGGPFSFSEITERLQVSRGSISTNTRLLVGMGLIEKTAKSGDRQDYFQLAKNPYVSLIAGITRRMKSTRALVQETKEHFLDQSCQKRLSELEKFYDYMYEVHSDFIKEQEGDD